MRPFKSWAEAYRLSRVDIGDATRRTIAAHLKTMSSLDDRDPKSVSPKRFRLPLRVLEQTGLRVGELHALEWSDVDEDGNRFRVREGKTASARRWVAVPDWLMSDIGQTCPREDRTVERRVFPGFNPNTVRAAMDRACRDAGIVHRHPHDLRHRYASLKIAEGVPVTAVAAQLGHSKKSLTLDVYSHVLLDEGS